MFWISYSTGKCSWNGHNSSEPNVRVLERNTSDGGGPYNFNPICAMYIPLMFDIGTEVG